MNPSNVNTPARQTLRQAVEHLDAGRAPQAEILIRQVLQTEPENHQALNLLGVVALNSGHALQSIEFFLQAIQLHGADAEYYCNLGVARLNTNGADEGEAALQTALKLKPGHPMANFNMGLRDLQSGRFEDALKRLSKAAKKMPHNLTAQNALGVAHSKCGKSAKAVQLFRSVLKAQPNHREAELNLAGALMEMGKMDEAIALYNGLIEKYPDQAQLYFNLGVALRKAGRSFDAIDAYAQALVLEPQFTDAHVNLSTIYSGQGNQDAALDHLKTACALRPDDIHILNNEARALFDAGFSAEALAACERVCAQNPGNLEALGIQVRVLQNDGRFADARASAAQALAVNPDAVPVLLALSYDKDHAFSDEEIQSLKKATAGDGADTAEAIQAWFALGKIHNDRGEYGPAFNFYKRGNALRDAPYNWTKADEQNVFASLLDTFSETFFQDTQNMGQDSTRPVFIVGMPRSGTTLVEQIIASHPSAAGGGELYDIQNISDDLARTLNCAAPYPACVKNLDAATANSQAERYLARLDQISKTAERVTDKMPGNYLHLGLIAKLLPNARVIYCRRDPMATCFSIYQQNFQGFHSYAYDLTKLGWRYRNHERLMDHWRSVLPLSILDVAYEDVIDDQEGQSRRILDFCDLKWDPSVLDFHKTERAVQTASLWQVRQPIFTSALKHWCAYEEFLGPLKEALDQGCPPYT